MIPDDVKDMAAYVLPHRILIQPDSVIRGVTPTSLVNAVLDSGDVPLAPGPAGSATGS